MKLNDVLDSEGNSIVLGTTYRDNITGVKGTALAAARYLYGPPTVMLEWAHEGSTKTDWIVSARLSPHTL